MDKCVGVLAVVGDVKAPSPLFHCLTCIERWTVRCLLLSCSLPFPLFLFHTLLPFVFPSLSSSLICSFLHALLNKNYAFLFNTMRLLNISANFAVDYQHH